MLELINPVVKVRGVAGPPVLPMFLGASIKLVLLPVLVTRYKNISSSLTINFNEIYDQLFFQTRNPLRSLFLPQKSPP
jgi:hypothetical protein